MDDRPSHFRQLRRTLWASAAFLAGFAVLIAVISHYYLIPALDALRTADANGRRQISATSLLLLAVILLILLIALGITFRIRRYFFPRGASTLPEKTQPFDAWAESAKRVPLDQTNRSED